MRLELPAILPLLLAALALGPGSAGAMQRETRPAERCELANLVLAGEVTSHEVRWAAGPTGGLETAWWISVDLVIQGAVSGDQAWRSQTLELVLPGGELGDLGQWVEDAPQLEEDARYLFLLEPHPDRGWQPVGGEAGVILLKDRLHPEAPTLTQVLREHGGCRA